MAQLSFSFPQNEEYLAEDFIILDENQAAKNFLDKFFSQKDFSIASMILKGEEGSGKSHLLHIFARKNAAQFLDEEKISKLNLSDFFKPHHFYILDDFDKISDEELLLRIINSAAEAKAFLVLAGKNISAFKLRDLVSRLKNILLTEIKNPSPDAIEQLLTNGFARRQIRVSQHEIKMISKKIDRSYKAIADVIKDKN